jgi:mono/diheme cytochrome c family protein
MMKLRRAVIIGVVCAVLTAAGLFAADTNTSNAVVTSAPVYVPDISHANDPLPEGVLAWNSLMQTTNASADQEFVRLTFGFTNVTQGSVTILGAHASCGCTQPELPSLPWTIPPGGNGEISASVNLEGKNGVLFKSLTVSTDKGSKELWMRITILPPVVPVLTDADRAQGVEMAKADRQAVFKADCATCHAKATTGKYGKALYDSACAICHEAANRATMVPDLRNLKTPTNDEFWRTWIAHGKAGTLMPAFSTAEGGPLNDMQIATIAAYLNMIIPSQPLPALTNAPAAN